MKMVSVYDSVGCILSHDVTQIIPGEFKGRLFKKGHIIKEEDIEKLLSIGKEHIYVWEPSEGELHENDAAIRISNLVLGDGACKSEEIKEGKVDFFADIDGVLKIDKEELFKLNSLGEIIVSTLHTNTPIKKGEKIMDKDLKQLELYDEDGKLVKLNVVAFFDMVNPDTEEKSEYVIVYDDDYTEDDIFALKVGIDEDGDDLLIPIDDEVELAAVQEAYDTIFADEE